MSNQMLNHQQRETRRTIRKIISTAMQMQRSVTFIENYQVHAGEISDYEATSRKPEEAFP